MPKIKKTQGQNLKSRQELFALLALVLLAGLFRLWLILTCDNGIDFHFNAYDKPIFTWHDWMQSDRIIPMYGYGPLHFMILRAIFALSGYDPLLIPRLVSLVFGVLCLLPIWAMTKRAFGTGAAIMACFAAAIYPLGARLSAVSLEVSLFNFLLLACVYYLDRASSGKNQGKWAQVIFAGLFLNLACATRFEGWLAIPIMTLLMLRASFIRAFVFGAIASVFPVAWMVASKIATGDPIVFASVSAAVQKVHSAGHSAFALAFGWPKILMATSTPVVVILAAVGLYLGLKKRKGIVPAAVGLYFFALFIFFAFRGTMALNETKYIASVGLLILPFFGFASIRTLYLRPGKTTGIVLLSLIVAAVGAFSVSKTIKDSKAFAASDQVIELCDFLNRQENSGMKVLLGVRYQGYILAKSGLPFNNFVLIPSDDKTGRRSETEFWNAVTAHSPCLIIHNTLPDLLDFQQIIPIDGRKVLDAKINGYKFEPVFARPFWMVLKVSPEASKTALQNPDNN